MLVEVVALAHGVHFLHLLTLVLPTVSCGSYPGLSGSPVIPKPLSRDPSQSKNKCCFWNFLLKDDQACCQVRLVHLVLVQVCLVHRHNLLVLRLWSVFTNTFAPQVVLEIMDGDEIKIFFMRVWELWSFTDFMTRSIRAVLMKSF